MDAPAPIEPPAPPVAREAAERVLTWGDLARYARTGCRRCFSAGFVQVREYAIHMDANGQRRLGEPVRHRCRCTERGLDRAGLVLVETPHGVVARRIHLTPDAAPRAAR